MATEEERIALFLDYENLAIGTREKLDGLKFDYRPLAEALAERGRVVTRRAYADWSFFSDDRRMLTRHNVELIEIPQRMGVRKNAADIKMAVDAMEMLFERDYLTTFVIGTGDSDFTPLVQKLRELNKRVVGVGVKASTSPLLPPACDEFLFYELLEGVEMPPPKRRTRKTPAGGDKAKDAKKAQKREKTRPADGDIDDLAVLVSQTIAGLQRGSGDTVLGSSLKRALLRKDPTFSEGNYGFRTLSELLRFLEARKVIELGPGTASGDAAVSLPVQGRGEEEAFALLRKVVSEMQAKNTAPLMSGLKNKLRKRQPGFSERQLGYSGFLQFCRAASTRGLVTLEWHEEADDYLLLVGPNG